MSKLKNNDLFILIDEELIDDELNIINKKSKPKKFKLDGDTKRVDLHNKNSTKSRINNRR
jgi:hypothetical protein